MRKTIFEKGNVVIAESAILAGCKFFSGYPITPQSELLEYVSWRFPEEGRIFIQAESEVASSGMVRGASIAGARAMTATSGPGLALMTEHLSDMCLARLPGVIVDVQRAANGISPEQSDYNYVTKGIGQNGQRAMAYAPGNLQECADIMALAFDKADQYRIPVFIMTDGMIGQMEEPVLLPEPVTERKHIPFESPLGRRGRGYPIKDIGMMPGNPLPYKNGMRSDEALEFARHENWDMYKGWVENEVLYDTLMMDDAEYVIVAYGSAARTCIDAVKMLRAQGIKIGMFRLISISPFPERQIAAFKGYKGVLTVEMSLPCNLFLDVEHYLDRSIPHRSYVRCGGNVIDEEGVCNAVLEMANEVRK